MEKGLNKEEFCEMGYLKRADGSCLYSDKNFAVIVSVFGPGDLKASKQIADKMSIEVTINDLPNMKRDFNFESLIKSLCESVVDINACPRTGVSLTIQLLEIDESSTFWRSACLNALCLALLDSGLPMKQTFVAVSVAKTKENLLVTLEANDRHSADVNFLFVFSNVEVQKGKNILASLSSGIFDMDIFQRALSLARMASRDLFSFQRSCVHKKLNRIFDVDNLSLKEFQ
uniref:Exoribonuclease phosphorolytic domain-containing protein n=1 Tax=Romanomermis culicivorax TaxID=13658 RepID=A0A915K0V8_ROMCU